MFKAYKYRIYPNKEQEELIQKTFGCCRFVYNKTLAHRKEIYETNKENMNKFDCVNYVNQVLKKQYEWLKEPDKWALSNSVYNMDLAYQKFFKENFNYPKFKSKKDNRKSYRTTLNGNNIEVSHKANKIKLPKLKWIDASVHRKIEGKIKSATISQNPSGKYFASILVESDYKTIKTNEEKIGLDLGVSDLLITSNGDKFKNIETTKKYEKKLSKNQRILSHKRKGSRNYNKQRIKVAEIYEKISNTRKDNLHKISHKLINENQVIVSENLKVLNMMKNHNLSKSIQDCSWYELTRQLEYKSDWYGRTYIKVNTYFPSSQLCSNCGHRNTETKDLSVRRWTCSSCGEIHDRDINASINILNEGLRILNS